MENKHALKSQPILGSFKFEVVIEKNSPFKHASRTVSCTKKRKRTTMRLILLYLSRKHKRRYVVTGRQWRTCTDRESFATTTNGKAEASQGLSPAMSFSPAQMKRSAERWRTRTRPGEKRRMARLYDIYRV
ncbi:hypothetical protein AMECASPLE_002966 [Ameca splendens]|uniref:Uncharacterized protein n=1 Tax=Ameca splendens TaxID=208324 RepID=A0ABV0XYK8_9TELE